MSLNDAKRANRSSSLRDIAQETLATIEHGSYELDDISYQLTPNVERSKQNTLYYAPNSSLSEWSSPPLAGPNRPRSSEHTEISIIEISTLQGARLMSESPPPDSSDPRKIGVLNFASAKNPGGGFLRGARAQEESIARSSTLYPTLKTDAAQQFYNLHTRDPKGGYYSHAMIYSPGVLLLRDDRGGWTAPTEVDVLTSPAVNAGVARRTLYGMMAGNSVEGQIETTMRERMARILFLFEQQAVQDVVLGSFGTGVFKNDVGMVARIWADLLSVKDARFKCSFDRVVFAIIGKPTFDEFKATFEQQTNRTDSD